MAAPIIAEAAAKPSTTASEPVSTASEPVRTASEPVHTARIVVFVPDPARLWLLEMATSLHGSLCDWRDKVVADGTATWFDVNLLEVPCSQAPRPNELWIVFGAHTDINMDWKRKYIIFNYEQHSSGVWSEKYLANLRGALAVWDYADSNASKIAERIGRRPAVVPFGWHPNIEAEWKRAQNESQEESKNKGKEGGRGEEEKKKVGEATTSAPEEGHRSNDVLFYGENNHRRAQMLLDAKRAGVKIHSPAGRVFGDDLRRLRLKHKVIVNLHYYSPSVLEISRILPAVADGCVVVSEMSDDAKLDEKFKEACVLVDAKADRTKIWEVCKRILSSEEEWKRLSEKNSAYARTQLTQDRFLQESTDAMVTLLTWATSLSATSDTKDVDGVTSEDIKLAGIPASENGENITEEIKCDSPAAATPAGATTSTVTESDKATATTVVASSNTANTTSTTAPAKTPADAVAAKRTSNSKKTKSVGEAATEKKTEDKKTAAPSSPTVGVAPAPSEEKKEVVEGLEPGFPNCPDLVTYGPGGKDEPPREYAFALVQCIRQESPVVERWVESMLGFLGEGRGCYVVCDTGSTDGTARKLKGIMERHKIAGRIVFKEWNYFGPTKTWALQRAFRDPRVKRARYLLWLDADEVFLTSSEAGPTEYPSRELITKLLHNLDKHARLGVARFLFNTRSGASVYPRLQIARNDRRYKWDYRVHEIFVSENPSESGAEAFLSDVSVLARKEGNSSRLPDRRFAHDVEACRKDLEEKPNDPRSTFYLAQTLHESGRRDCQDEAVRLYEKRVENKTGYNEERYIAMLRLGRMHIETDRAKSYEWWRRATKEFPMRLEAAANAVGTAIRFGVKSEMEIACSIAETAQWRETPPLCALFAEPTVYHYLFGLDWSLAAHHLGHNDVAIAISKRLLEFARKLGTQYVSDPILKIIEKNASVFKHMLETDEAQKFSESVSISKKQSGAKKSEIATAVPKKVDALVAADNKEPKKPSSVATSSETKAPAKASIASDGKSGGAAAKKKTPAAPPSAPVKGGEDEDEVEEEEVPMSYTFSSSVHDTPIVLTKTKSPMEIKNATGLSASDSLPIRISTRVNSLLVVDDFFKNPDEVRAFALKQRWTTNGERDANSGESTRCFANNEIRLAFQLLLGRRITKWSTRHDGRNGRFMSLVENSNTVILRRPVDFVAEIFLNPDAARAGGVGLFERESKLVSDAKSGMERLLLVEHIANVYNRLVIFDGRRMHGSPVNFGKTREDGRLILRFEFCVA